MPFGRYQKESCARNHSAPTHRNGRVPRTRYQGLDQLQLSLETVRQVFRISTLTLMPSSSSKRLPIISIVVGLVAAQPDSTPRPGKSHCVTATARERAKSETQREPSEHTTFSILRTEEYIFLLVLFGYVWITEALFIAIFRQGICKKTVKRLHNSLFSSGEHGWSAPP